MDIRRKFRRFFMSYSITPNRLINKQIKLLKQSFSSYPIPFARVIHIETRSRCNSTCSFCMANYNDDPREDLLMEDNLVYKILDELKEIDYKNRISFYNNNEPFLDKRINKFITIARKATPQAYLELKSNGRGLTMEKIIEIFSSGLDTLYINDYTDTINHSKSVNKIIDELKSIRRFKGHMISRTGEYYNRIIIEKRNLTENLGTRAGTAPNAKIMSSALNAACFRPFEMMTKSPEGYVAVCSEDFYYSIKMGDVNNEKLFDIWNSKKYQKVRKELIQGNRIAHNACSKCDYKGFTYEMFNEYGL